MLWERRARIASRQALPTALRRRPGGTAQTKSGPSAMRSIMGNGPLYSYRKMLCANALGRSRTFNLQIKSLLLCQLSYECKITFAKATCRS